MDLMVTATADLDTPLDLHLILGREVEELDDELHETCLPDFYKRTFRHPYLQERSFTFDDYEYFPVGVTGKLNPRFSDYVIFPVEDNHSVVGYVARIPGRKKNRRTQQESET